MNGNLMWYYEEDYSKFFDRFKEHPRKKNLIIFRCRLFYLHIIEGILNTYLWSHKVSSIKYKLKNEYLIAAIQLSDIPKFTHIDIVIRPPYDIFELKDTVEQIKKNRYDDYTEFVEVIYKLCEGKIQYQEEKKFVLAFVHTIQYDFPYYHIEKPPNFREKRKSNRERIRNYLKDEGIDLDFI